MFACTVFSSYPYINFVKVILLFLSVLLMGKVKDDKMGMREDRN